MRIAVALYPGSIRPGAILLASILFASVLASVGAAQPEAYDAALKSLSDEKGEVRVAACARLGRLGDGRAVPALIARLRDDVPAVRVAAVDALARLGDEVAVPHLSRSLEDDSAAVRGRALLALGKLAGKYAGPKVARHLLDPDPGVRVCAVRALGELGDPLRADAIRALLDRTEEDRDHVLLATATVALVRLEGKKTLDDLFRRAGDADAFDSWLMRSTLAWAVGEAKDRERLPFVKRCFAVPDDRVASAAGVALLSLGEEAVVVAALEDASALRRRVAVSALVSQADDRHREKLLPLMRDPSIRVRLEATIGLSKMGALESFPALLEGLASPSSMVWGGCAGELRRAYGQDFGRRPDAWAKWFRANREKLLWDAEERVWRIRS